MPEPLVAHGGHWIVQAVELAPVAILMIWLGVKAVRGRRTEVAPQREEEREGPDPSG